MPQGPVSSDGVASHRRQPEYALTRPLRDKGSLLQVLWGHLTPGNVPRDNLSVETLPLGNFL